MPVIQVLLSILETTLKIETYRLGRGHAFNLQ